MRVKKAVITAAGLGTRFLPLTKSLPKEMLPLVDRPVIQYSVEEAIACGVETIIIVTAPGSSTIKDYFGRSFELELTLERKGEARLAERIRRLSSMADIRYVHQMQPLGLGDAVLAAKSELGNEPFVLLLPDDLFEEGELVLKRMLEISQRYGGSVVAVKRMAANELGRYGVIKPKEAANRIYQVMSLVEKPELAEAPSDLAIMGRYVLMPEILDVLKDTAPSTKGEIQLTDALQRLLKAQPLHAYELEGERYDVGTPLGWLKTTMALALKDPNNGLELRDYLDTLLQEPMRRRD